MRRALRCLLPAAGAWAMLATAALAADGPGTMRVDYFHTGGKGTEIFALRPRERRAPAMAGPPGAHAGRR